MSDAYVQVAPDSTGKKIQTYENTVSAQTVEAQAVVLVNSSGVPYTPVTPVFFNPGGRLTTESGVAISTSDKTSQATIYYTPYQHNNIYTYSGSVWQSKTFSQISLSLTITSGKNYDVFINSAATTLSLSAAWSSDTVRTDALSTQDSVIVLSSDHTKLWLGTIRASGSNVTEDSTAKRFVWNFYNQVPRTLTRFDNSTSHTYGTLTWREWNNGTGGPHRISFVTGKIQFFAVSGWSDIGVNSGGTARGYTSVSLNSTTAEGNSSMSIGSPAAVNFDIRGSVSGVEVSVEGFNELTQLELGFNATVTFSGYKISAFIHN